MHVHKWEPILNWSGRYRCPKCGAFGYHPVVVDINFKRTRIEPYRCVKCRRWAVAKESKNYGKTKYWHCAKHRLKKASEIWYPNSE